MNGSGCKTCAIYPNCTAEYRGSTCAAIRSEFGLGDPVTNADRIRSMSDEELAKWLANMFDCHYCPEHERLGDNPLLSAEPCDQKCEQHCFDWLKQPYKEEK